ncbi:hypothetical protein [Bremerella alba]|uniref:Uncharacterized protein n=1 Tax=Bremerella alba TaxID=980252 RepID=A0A7V8V893_9BACT|nr:hypothetical protein [Bremerella alba]MBA2116800.1 hypothetical protein [Bremerella alba]
MATLETAQPGATRHWQTFSTGAKAYIARRFWQYRPDFRTRVVQAAIDHWPTEQATSGKAAIVNRLFHDTNFRRDLALGPITWWLLGLAVKAILNALVDYWFQTQQRR